MRHVHIPLFCLALTACDLLQIGTSSGSSSGGSGDTDSGTVQGTNCGTDTTIGATLCLGISLCPDVTVDTEVFPACGFRVSGTALDVECVCGSYICPLGSADTCDAVAKLLSEQNEGQVCARAGAGQCVEMIASTSSSSGGSSSCDTTCRDECAGDPTCIVSCGC